MICLKCKKQIPDDATKCLHCGTEVFHKHQVKKEISIRRWQRWVFYIIIITIILTMLGVIIKIMDSNSKLLVNMANVQKISQKKDTKLAETINKSKELEKIKNSLEAEKNELSDNLTKKEKELKNKLEEIQKQVNEKIIAQGVIDRMKEIATKNNITTTTLITIKPADIIYIGKDSDKDGLIDDLELAIKTNINNPDTDNDGYSDRSEYIKGYNPLGEGNVNQKLADAKYRGKLFSTSIGTSSQIWYIGTNGFKYFLATID